MTAGQWQNNDGLNVTFGNTKQASNNNKAATVIDYGNRGVVLLDFTYNTLPTVNIDSDNSGTNDAYGVPNVYIPAGSYITGAYLIVDTQWATADTATLTIGLYKADGTAIDADGIDAAIGAAALVTGSAVACDGALVKGVIHIGTDNGYIGATKANTWTAGTARLVIEYYKGYPY